MAWKTFVLRQFRLKLIDFYDIVKIGRKDGWIDKLYFKKEKTGHFVKYIFSEHVFKRMAERGFSPDTIKDVIKNGMVIKEYLDDTPYPSRLIFGYDDNRPVHVVSAYDQNDDIEYIITVYEPNTQLWTSDFTKRRN